MKFIDYPDNKPKKTKQYLILTKNKFNVYDVHISTYDKEKKCFDYCEEKEILGYTDIANGFVFFDYSEFKPIPGQYYICLDDVSETRRYFIEYFSNTEKKFNNDDDKVKYWTPLPDIKTNSIIKSILKIEEQEKMEDYLEYNGKC